MILGYTNQNGYYEYHHQVVVYPPAAVGGWCKLFRAESTDFVTLERIQQQVYIEVEGSAPGDQLTSFTQDDRAQQTGLNSNSNVPQVGRKGSGRKPTAGCWHQRQELEAVFYRCI